MKNQITKIRIPIITLIIFAMILTVSTSLFLVPVSAANSTSDITVMVDGKKVSFTDQKPVVQNERTLVPIRFVAEALGYNVIWNPKDNTAVIDHGRIILYIGTDQAILNGKAVTLDTKSTVLHERTMVPLRVIAETLDCTVDWVGETYTVLVNRRDATGKEMSLFDRFRQTDLFWYYKTASNEYLVPKADYKTAADAQKSSYLTFWIDRPLDRSLLLNPESDCSVHLRTYHEAEMERLKDLCGMAYPTRFNDAYKLALSTIKGELWQTSYSYDSILYPLFAQMPITSGTFGTTYLDNREVELSMNPVVPEFIMNLSSEGYRNPETPRTLTADEVSFCKEYAKMYFHPEQWKLK